MKISHQGLWIASFLTESQSILDPNTEPCATARGTLQRLKMAADCLVSPSHIC